MEVCGDITTLEAETEQLIETDAQYRLFAASVLELAEQFMAEEIEELLLQYMTEELVHVA